MVVGVFVGAGLGFVYLVSTLFDGPAGKDERDEGPEEDEDPTGRPVNGKDSDRRMFWR